MVQYIRGHLERESAQKRGGVVLYLDTRNRVADREILYVRTLNTSPVRIAEVFRGAIVVVHNHPSVDPNPSLEGVELTRKLVDVQMLDHAVVAAARYRSQWEQVGF